MGTLRTTLIDKNRYAKRYPLIRAPKRLTYRTSSDLGIEVGSVYFDNASSGTLSFEMQFPDTEYQISVAARDDGSGTADVNLYITSKTTDSVTINSSAPFTGYVDVFVIRIS
jgi:hypothetical protein